jgi:hypothetical protein
MRDDHVRATVQKPRGRAAGLHKFVNCRRLHQRLVLDGGRFAVSARAQADLLSGFGAMSTAAEHPLARQGDLHPAADYLGRDGAHHRVWPDEAFTSEAAADERGDDMHVLFRHAQRLGHGIARTYYPLGGFIQRELIAIPVGDGRRRLHGIVVFDGRDVIGLMTVRSTAPQRT